MTTLRLPSPVVAVKVNAPADNAPESTVPLTLDGLSVTAGIATTSVPIGKLTDGVKETTVIVVSPALAIALRVMVWAFAPPYPSVNVLPFARPFGSAVTDKDVIGLVPDATESFVQQALG